jgi:hypothetical protein
MNCRQAQQDIALLVGHDLDDPRERDDVKRHVATCPDCRRYFRRMKDTLKVLGQADAPQTYTATGSLWPVLSRRINDRRREGPRSRFNGWAPFVAMTAACLLMMFVISHPQEPAPGRLMGPPTAKGPVLPVMRDMSPLFIDVSNTRPQVRFEERNAAEDVEELRRRSVEDDF